MLKRFWPLLLAVGVWATPARAQDPAPADSVAALDLPEAVVAAVEDVFSDPRRLKFRGPTRVPAGEVVRGDVAVLEGPYEVLGRVEGSVVVVNGDVRLHPGAAITGDLLVVGGIVTGADSARVGGEIIAYTRRLEYHEEGGRIVRARRRPIARGENGLEVGWWGRGDFLVSTGRSYNRVEGLPITFGPRVETEGRNPLRVQALAIYRTSAGFTLDPDRMGYQARAEQFLGGRRELRVGVGAHSLVEPIEEWHVSDLENGLSTFLFHRDFRDYYEREGLSGFLTWTPRAAPLEATLELRSETHRALSPESPWTIFDNGEDWRPQPLAATGDLTSVALQAQLDTRSSALDPATGWLVRWRVERAIDVDLSRLAPGPGGVALRQPDAYDAFTTGLIDVRRYNRVDPVSRLNFRLLAGGSLDGSPLPPQRQHALGGEGSLPGYQLFELDCGARAALVQRPEPAGAIPFFPRYGCDAFALAQAEFRAKLGFDLSFDPTPWDDDDEGWGIGWAASPEWAVFVDAGRGWSVGDDRPDTPGRVDAGLGLLLGRFGIFVARPLTRGGDGYNIFIRLGPRF